MDRKHKFKKLIAYTFYQFQDPYYHGSAPQVAFFMFLSVVPTIILISQTLNVFGLSIRDVQAWVNITVDGQDTIGQLLLQTPTGLKNIFLIALAIWASSRMYFGMMRVTNYTFTDGQLATKGWLPDRVRSIVSMVIILITLVFSMVVMVYLPVWIDYLFHMDILSENPNNIIMALRWLVMMALYFFMISYIYLSLPHRRVRYRDILPGTIFSSIAFLIVTFLYNLYTQAADSNAIIYGSTSNMVILAFWFWLLSWVLIIGIVINRAWWQIRDKNAMHFRKEFLDRRMPIQVKPLKKFVEDNIDPPAGEIVIYEE